jgi:NADPH2:quinone reductase
VLLPAAAAIPVPDGVEDHNAAQFVVNPLTALLMATRYLTPKEGEYLVQTAAASVLGKLVCNEHP